MHICKFLCGICKEKLLVWWYGNARRECVMNIILLIISPLLGTGRSVFTKKMSSGSSDKKGFYMRQEKLKNEY